jgi:uncharacterized protein (TIGR00725 family)
MIIAVIGGRREASAAALAQAEAVGRAIAGRGAVLICGGLEGVMEAACRGARDAGGQTIGVLPGRDASEANPYVDLPIVTGMGYARNIIVVLSADAVVAIDGSYGTLSEIAYALNFGKPVVGLDTWRLASGGRQDDSIVRAATAEEAVRLACEAAAGGRTVPTA